MKRQRMSSKTSRKVFKRGAQRIHPRNLNLAMPMRGGIRL